MMRWVEKIGRIEAKRGTVRSLRHKRQWKSEEKRKKMRMEGKRRTEKPYLDMLHLSLLSCTHFCLSSPLLNFLLTSFRSYSSAPSLYVDILCRCPLNVLKRQIKNSKYPGKQRLIALAAMIARYRSCSSLRLYSAFPSFFFYCNRLPVSFGLTWYHWTLGNNTFKIPPWSCRKIHECCKKEAREGCVPQTKGGVFGYR